MVMWPKHHLTHNIGGGALISSDVTSYLCVRAEHSPWDIGLEISQLLNMNLGPKLSLWLASFELLIQYNCLLSPFLTINYLLEALLYFDCMMG